MKNNLKKFFVAILVSMLPLYIQKMVPKNTGINSGKKAQTNILQNISNRNNAKIPWRLLVYHGSLLSHLWLYAPGWSVVTPLARITPTTSSEFCIVP